MFLYPKPTYPMYQLLAKLMSTNDILNIKEWEVAKLYLMMLIRKNLDLKLNWISQALFIRASSNLDNFWRYLIKVCQGEDWADRLNDDLKQIELLID